MAARKLKRSEQLPPTSPYQLLIRLAAGGMGAVYLGVLRGTSEPLFAIKRPHAHLAEETDFRKMFVTEARLASRIRHPHAIGVIDVDETDGELLMVMTYVEGGSLGELLSAAHESNRRIPAPVALRIAVDAARGLHAAHQLTDAAGTPLGIVHRDISPQNILVGVDGRAAIVDFGVAKAVGVEATRTASDILKGKTAYMAPEYVVDRCATPQSDVFSLGVVCWEMLANRRLFKGSDDVDTMRRLVDPTPARMLSEVTSIDLTISAIVARALSKDPSKRFRSAEDFGNALEAKARAAELLASPREVSATLSSLLLESLDDRRELVAAAMREQGIAPPPAQSAPRRPDAPGDLHVTMEMAPDSATRLAQTVSLGRAPVAPSPATVPLPLPPVSSRRTLPLATTQERRHEPPTPVPMQTAAAFEVRQFVPAKPRAGTAVLIGLGGLTVGVLAVGAVLAVNAYGVREPDTKPSFGVSSAQGGATVVGSPAARASIGRAAATAEPPGEILVLSAGPTVTASASARLAAPLGPRPLPTSTSWKPKANPY